MYTFLELFPSPIGPPTVLLLGAIVQIVCGRWVRRPLLLTGLALAFAATAFALLLNLRLQPVVPVYSQPWQPLLHSGANLYWVGDGWNWYISSLILLLGGLGILLALNNEEVARGRHIHGILAVDLAVIAASLTPWSAGLTIKHPATALFSISACHETTPAVTPRVIPLRRLRLRGGRSRGLPAAE